MKRDPLAVAYLCEFPTLLGGERSLLAFLSRRADAEVAPVVVVPTTGLLAETLLREGIPTVAWPARGRQAAAELAPALRERGVQLVHANSLMTAGAARSLADALGTPAVAHVRDIMTLSQAHRDRLGTLDAVITVSDAVAAALRRQGVPGERIERIYNAVDVDALQEAARPGAIRRELDVGADAPLVGCIGQIALRKGQDLFLDAAARVATEFADAHFVIAGARYSQKAESRAFEQSLHDKAAQPPLAGRAHLLGYREDIPSLLADLDVLVVPSRQEPLSRTLLEGLAIGVPAVATAVGGTSEILTGSDAGVMVPPDDPEQMAQAVRAIVTGGVLREAQKAAGPPHVRRHFSPGRQVEVIRALYERILS